MPPEPMGDAMKSFIYVSSLILGAVLTIGCSSASDTTSGDEQDVKKAAPGTKGGLCGGIGGIQCKSGLSCQLSATGPDASGKCVAVAAGEEGGMCGGIA